MSMQKAKTAKKSTDRNKIILISIIAAVLVIGIVLLSIFLLRPTEPTNTVVIKVKKYGKIVIELDPEAAPITVENFKQLVADGFYKNSSFHRIVPGFVIQGGASGKGESAATIKGEFLENGVDNPIAHERGVVSMARTSIPDSASSQFFIVLETSADNSYWLDGKYAAFGRVTEGMDVVDAIAAVKTYGDSPLQDIRIVRAYFK